MGNEGVVVVNVAVSFKGEEDKEEEELKRFKDVEVRDLEGILLIV